ncbi:MAG: DUF4293 family protein [Bacteroidota bacterium]
MLQRIQSLYLLLGGALLVVFAVFSDVWSAGIRADMSWLGSVGLGLAGASAAIAFVAVALFKDRSRQRQIILVAQIATLLTVAAAVGGLFLRDPEIAATQGAYLLALAPVVAYVLLRLAQRGVDADIKLVKSMDRLR